MNIELDLENEVRARGNKLVENHDKETIEAVIEEINKLDDPKSDQTAEILEWMVEGE